MLHLKILDLFDRNSTFTIYPFAINVVVVAHSDNFTYASDIAVGNETKAPRFLSPLVFHNDTILQVTELKEIVPKLVELKIVWKTSYKYFPVLGIVDVTVLGEELGLDLSGGSSWNHIFV